MVVLPHRHLVAEHVGDREALEGRRELHRIGGARLVHGGLEELEDRPEAGRVEIVVVGGPELLGPALGVRLAGLHRDVLVERHDRAHLAVSGGADRGGAAAQVRVHRVVADVEPRVHAALDQEGHVGSPVAGDERLGPRGLDLGDVGREVLDLAERDQLVAHHLHVRTNLAQERLHVALHRLPEEVVLVEQVDLGHVLGQGPHHGLGLHAHVRVHAEVPVAALLVGQLGGDRSAVDVDDPVGRVPLVVLVHSLDEGGRDVGARALHDHRDVLVGGRFQGEQRLGRLRLVVEGDQLELLPEGAAPAVDVVDDVLELLQVLIAHLREGPREGIGVHDLDGVLGVGRPGAEDEAGGQKGGCDPREPVAHGASSLSGAGCAACMIRARRG